MLAVFEAKEQNARVSKAHLGVDCLSELLTRKEGKCQVVKCRNVCVAYMMYPHPSITNIKLMSVVPSPDVVRRLCHVSRLLGAQNAHHSPLHVMSGPVERAQQSIIKHLFVAAVQHVHTLWDDAVDDGA